MRLVRKDNGRNHWYVDLNNGNARVKGVTTWIDAGTPKKALINWAGNATAEYAVDNWDALAGLSPSARMKKMQGGRYESKDEAANRGTQVHKFGERLMAGEKVTVPDLLAPYVDSYVRFMDEFQLRARVVEGLVYSDTGNHCGTFDIYGDILLPDLEEYEHLPRDSDGFVCDVLMDAKTNRSGIFGETALQLAAYRFSRFMQPDPKDPGTAEPMPNVNWTCAVWIRPNGYSLIPVHTDESVYRAFRYVQQVAEFDAISRDLVGAPVEPPTAARYAITRITEEG